MNVWRSVVIVFCLYFLLNSFKKHLQVHIYPNNDSNISNIPTCLTLDVHRVENNIVLDPVQYNSNDKSNGSACTL